MAKAAPQMTQRCPPAKNLSTHACSFPESGF